MGAGHQQMVFELISLVSLCIFFPMKEERVDSAAGEVGPAEAVAVAAPLRSREVPYGLGKQTACLVAYTP